MKRIAPITRTFLVTLFIVAAAVGLGRLLRAEIPQVPPNAWAPASEMASVRAGASGTLLPDGRVLIAGGIDENGATASTERFAPTGGGFLSTPAMQFARANHTATMLNDGRVLVAGGTGGIGAAEASAEIYDASANAWLPAGSLNVARRGHTATLLADGRVLVAGGDDGGNAIASLEVFDPQTMTFSLVDAGEGAVARTLHAAALLQDGRVLIAGGYDGSNALASTSIYDPETNTIGAGPTLSSGRSGLSATTLLDGKVLIAGGAGASGELASAEIYNPASNSFVATDNTLTTARQNHLAFLLPHNNQVLIVGGLADEKAVAATEYFTPWEGTNGVFCAQAVCASGYVGPAPSSVGRAWAAGSALSFAASATNRSGPGDGLLVVAGGSGQKSAELFGFATIKTDKVDYRPGSTVKITGSGWQPEEWVAIILKEDPLLDEHALELVRADQNGNVESNEFQPDEHDIGIRFYATAYGQQSQAQTSFTDDQVTNTIDASADGTLESVTITAGNSVVVNYSIVASNTIPSGDASGCNAIGGSPATVNLSVPAQVTASPTALSITGCGNLNPVAFSSNTPGNYTISVSSVTGGKFGSLWDTAPASFTLIVDPAVSGQTITVTTSAPSSATYGSSFSVAATASSGLPVAITATGGCSVTSGGSATATVTMTSGTTSCVVHYNQAGNSSYNPAPEVTNTTTAQKANATVVVTPYDVPYNGLPHSAMVVSITGVNGETGATVGTVDVSNTTHTNAGTYASDYWFFTGTANYNNIGNTTITDEIDKADATVVVNTYDVPYDGQPHSATVVSITGVNGETGATVGTVDVSNTTHTNAGTYASDYWSFTGTANYNNIGNTTITDEIDKANAVVVVTAYDVPYDGLQHTASVVSITGVNGEAGATVGTVDVSHTAHTNAGTYSSDYWFFTGAANYNNIPNTTITDEIDKVNATVVVTPYNVQYDGDPHTATYTINGVNGETGATVGIVTLNTTHTLVGTYSSDTWSFTGTANYNNISTTTITDTITTAYCFNGFLSPIGGSVEGSNGGSFADPVRSFKLGSTIPVKFIINALNGSTCGVPVTTGIHTLQAAFFSSAIDSDTPIDASPTDAATLGNQFRLTNPEWHFNLSTKGLKAGTWQLKATLQDGSVKTVWITIKK